MRLVGKAIKLSDQTARGVDHALSRALQDYRDTPHPATGVAPQSFFGKGANLSGERLQKIRQRGWEWQRNACKAKPMGPTIRLHPEQPVLVKNHRKTSKFHHPFMEDPFVVQSRVGTHSYGSSRQSGQTIGVSSSQFPGRIPAQAHKTPSRRWRAYCWPGLPPTPLNPGLSGISEFKTSVPRPSWSPHQTPNLSKIAPPQLSPSPVPKPSRLERNTQERCGYPTNSAQLWRESGKPNKPQDTSPSPN